MLFLFAATGRHERNEMAKKQTLTVTTDFGTFSRTTARTYAYVVVALHERAEYLESIRQRDMASSREELARYRHAVSTRVCETTRTGIGGDWDRKMHQQLLDDGSYQRWIAGCETTIAELEQQGRIVADNDRVEVLGWSGRLDLAGKLKLQSRLRFRTVHIVDVATSAVVG